MVAFTSMRSSSGRRAVAGTLFACTVALLAVGTFGASGCTAENPDYDAPFDGGSADRPRDLGSPDCGVADGGTCKAGERGCAPSCDGWTSLACASKTYVADRVCPSGATCRSGYCVAPAARAGSTIGSPCSSETACYVSQQTASVACEPFVVNGGKSIDWRCGQRIGEGASGGACTRDSECRSGFCIADRRTCFRACAGADVDCPVRNKTQLVCRPVRIVVEGVPVMSTSCVLP